MDSPPWTTNVYTNTIFLTRLLNEFFLLDKKCFLRIDSSMHLMHGEAGFQQNNHDISRRRLLNWIPAIWSINTVHRLILNWVTSIVNINSNSSIDWNLKKKTQFN